MRIFFMEGSGSRNQLVEFIWLTGLAVILSQMSVFFFLFLVPIQILFLRKGMKLFLYSSLVVLIVVFVAGLFRISSVTEAGLRMPLLALEIVFPLLFLAGLFINNNIELRRIDRQLYKVFIASGVMGLLSIPLVLVFKSNQDLMNLLQGQMENAVNFVRTGIANSSVAGYSADFNSQEMIELIKEIFFRNYLFSYSIILAGCIWLGDFFAKKISGKQTNTFENFKMPEVMIWPLLLSWAGILLDAFFSLGVIRYVLWNAGLILLFFYGMHGLGIVRFLFRKYKILRSYQILFWVLLVVLLIWPGVNIIVVIGIPGLGISELWVNFRQIKRS